MSKASVNKKVWPSGIIEISFSVTGHKKIQSMFFGCEDQLKVFSLLLEELIAFGATGVELGAKE